jgi:hypothetical protein
MWRCIAIIYGAAFVFMLAGMYLFEVVPQEYGVKKDILFPFSFLKSKAKFLTGDEEKQWQSD